MSSPKSILVVEDEQIIAHSIQRSLLKAGYSVPGLASSAEEALRMVEQFRPDLILMDIHIQGSMDGIQAAGLIKELHHLPFIYLTAHTDAATLERAKLTEPLGYLVKPVNHSNLPSAIEMALYKSATDRKLEAQRALFATILRTIAEAVIVADSDGAVQFLNSAAERLTGWTQAEAEGQPFDSVAALNNGSERSLLSRCLASRTTLSLPRDATILTKKGTQIPVDGQIAISTSEGRIAGAMITLHDATARRIEERQIRQEQKMLSVGQLANDIACDFYGLFDLIARSGEEMLEGSDSTAETVEYSARLIKDTGDAGVSMARQLLEFGKADGIRPEPLNLNSVIEERASLYSKLCGANISLQTKLASDLHPVLSHPLHLEKLVLNLLLSAKHSMPNGGTINIATSNADCAADDSGALRPYARVLVEVERNAITGIPSTPPAAAGNPELTLAIVNSIVTVGEGFITTSKENDSCSTTEVLLPAMLPAEVEPPAATECFSAVLTVGLDPLAVRMLRNHLAEAGCNLLDAESVQRALNISESSQQRIDLIIVDGAGIPALSQRRLFSIVSSRWKDVKLLSLCTADQQISIPRSTVLSRPFELQDLLATAASLAGVRLLAA